jgi:hypothetical protein
MTRLHAYHSVKLTESKYWARLGCWISPCYGPFSFGAHFETCKLFIYLIFKFFFGPR